MHPDVKEILYTEEQLAQRVKEMGAEVSRKYADSEKPIILISVLRGAAIFMSDLARCITIPCEMDYMAVSSYGSGVKTSGVVKVLKDLSGSIEGRHVVIAEDIVDSGLTLSHLLELLSTRNPASIDIVTLLHKERPNQVPIDCFQVGFECPDEFIVGYGLDYAERYRNLPYIGILKPEVYEK